MTVDDVAEEPAGEDDRERRHAAATRRWGPDRDTMWTTYDGEPTDVSWSLWRRSDIADLDACATSLAAAFTASLGAPEDTSDHGVQGWTRFWTAGGHQLELYVFFGRDPHPDHPETHTSAWLILDRADSLGGVDGDDDDSDALAGRSPSGGRAPT